VSDVQRGLTHLSCSTFYELVYLSEHIKAELIHPFVEVFVHLHDLRSIVMLQLLQLMLELFVNVAKYKYKV